MQNKKLARQMAVILGSTLLASSWNAAWSADLPTSLAEPPSCSNIRNYLDCNSVGRLEDIVFVFDTTGSMEGEITEMQSAVIEFSETISTAGIDYRLGLTEYQTCNDNPYNVYNSGILTQDETIMRDWIQSLKATGGGSESVIDALAHAANDHQWRPNSNRIIVLIGDEPPQCSEEGNTLDSVISLLRSEGIVTHVVGSNEDSMRRIASETGGSFFEIRATDNFSSIINSIADLISCTYHINSVFSYKDDVLGVETKLIGAEQKVIPHIESELELTVSVCRDGVDCMEFNLIPTVTGSGEASYQQTADVAVFKDSVELTDLSILIKGCGYSTSLNSKLHIGDCVADVTPMPNIPVLETFVDGNYAEASWGTEPYANGFKFFYAPYSNPIGPVTLNNVTSMLLGLQTSISGNLKDGIKLYTAVQAYNCSGNSDYSNLGVVDIP